MPPQQASRPAYQPYYVYPPAKKPMPVWQILAIIGTVFGALFLTCGLMLALVAHTPAQSSSPSSGGFAPSTFETPIPTATTGPSKLGDTITIDDVSTTITSAQVIPGDDFAKPKPGYEFVVVHVLIENHSGSEIDYNPFNFHAWDGNGNITDHEFLFPDSYTSNNELHAGSLAPGGHVEADLLFQFPQGDHQAKVTWVYGLLSNDTEHAWLLGI